MRSLCDRVSGGAGVIALIGLLVGGPVIAEPQTDAVGRISYGTTDPAPGTAICSGVLVAPDLVLTAAHCVGADPSQIRFAAGLSEGQARAWAQGSAVLSLPLNPRQRASTDAIAALAYDLAVVRLATPLTDVMPLSLTSFDPTAEMLLQGYRRDRPDRVHLDASCLGTEIIEGVLALSCPVVSGLSGAPLLIRMEHSPEWRVVAVVVAQARGDGVPRSFAAVPGPDLLARLAEATAGHY